MILSPALGEIVRTISPRTMIPIFGLRTCQALLQNLLVKGMPRTSDKSSERSHPLRESLAAKLQAYCLHIAPISEAARSCDVQSTPLPVRLLSGTQIARAPNCRWEHKVGWRYHLGVSDTDLPASFYIISMTTITRDDPACQFNLLFL